MIVFVLRGEVFTAIPDTVEIADRVVQLFIQCFTIQRQTKIPVRQDIVTDIAALDKLDIRAALQAFQTDKGFEFAET